jgi:hypothetical protein
LLEYIRIIFLVITCFIILLTLIKQKRKSEKGYEWGFLISSFFLTLLLALIIVIKPHHLIRDKLGVSNLIIYLFYFALVTIYFLKYIKIILRFKYVLIIISFTFFGLANTVDLLSDGQLIDINYNEILEDFFHILGILFWLMYFIDYSILIKRKINNY